MITCILFQNYDNKENTIKKQLEVISSVKKESHKRKKLLIAQQQIMHAGTESYHKVRQYTFIHA